MTPDRDIRDQLMDFDGKQSQPEPNAAYIVALVNWHRAALRGQPETPGGTAE